MSNEKDLSPSPLQSERLKFERMNPVSIPIPRMNQITQQFEYKRPFADDKGTYALNQQYTFTYDLLGREFEPDAGRFDNELRIHLRQS